MTEDEKAQIIAVMQDAVTTGKLREALHQEVAPLLKANAGKITRLGTVQSATAVLVSPVTLARWAGRNIAIGASAVYHRGKAASHKRAEARKAKAEVKAEVKAALSHIVEQRAAKAAAGVVDPLGSHNCPAGGTVLDAVTGNLEPGVAKA